MHAVCGEATGLTLALYTGPCSQLQCIDRVVHDNCEEPFSFLGKMGTDYKMLLSITAFTIAPPLELVSVQIKYDLDLPW